jgi:hypothetical protein
MDLPSKSQPPLTSEAEKLLAKEISPWIRLHRGILVFVDPKYTSELRAVQGIIVDLVNLGFVWGWKQHPHHTLEFNTGPSRTNAAVWSLAKAAQLIRHSCQPRRWVAIELGNDAWECFRHRGGLRSCRQTQRCLWAVKSSLLPTERATNASKSQQKNNN